MLLPASSAREPYRARIATNVLYNVSQLMREPTGSTRRYSIDDQFTLPYEGSPVARVVGPVTLIRTLNGILARAELDAEAPMQCSRCLGPAGVSLRLHLEEEFLPTIDPVTGARLPIPDEPTPFRIDEHHHLDLSEAVRQASVLEEPMAPLCRPDCPGLCPECGADRNTTDCACRTGPVDARWAALREALNDEN